MAPPQDATNNFHLYCALLEGATISELGDLN